MRILLDCRPLLHTGPAGERNRLILSIVTTLAVEGSAEWLLLVDQTYRPGLFPGFPDLPVVSIRSLPGRPGWKLWYDWQVPRLVRKEKPDLVLLTGGVAAGSLAVPQCVWMPVRPGEMKGRDEPPLYAARLKESVQRAAIVFCCSEKDRSYFSDLAGGGEERFVVVNPWPSAEAAELSTADKESIKASYAETKEYFFVDVAGVNEHAIIGLLKAFSQFKKRQQSNLRLVIAGIPAERLREKLETYKYRKDVHWYESAEGRGRVMAAAYAALLPFEMDTLGVSLLDAWKAGVPVVAVEGGRLQQMGNDALLAARAADPAALAGCMMSLYKDELLRSRLISQGHSRLGAFDLQQSVDRVQEALGKALTVVHKFN